MSSAMPEVSTAPSSFVGLNRRAIVRIRTLLLRIGLDSLTISTMIKLAIPPVLGVAIYQADAMTKTLGTLNTLAPIMALCCPYTMPRAQFLQSIGLNIIVTCVACAMSFLGLYATLQARYRTQDISNGVKYNSSASVVCAIFLFFNIYLINTLHAKVPSFLYPSLCYTTFVGIIFTNIHRYLTMEIGARLIWSMMVNFFVGYALATGTALLVFPVSNRSIAFTQQAAFLTALRFPEHSTPPQERSKEEKIGPDEVGGSTASAAVEGQAFSNSGTLAGMYARFAALHSNVMSAQQDFAWGKLKSADLEKTNQLLRHILIPSLGLATIEDIFHTVNTNNESRETSMLARAPDQVLSSGRVHEEVLGSLHEALELLSYVVNHGLQHSAILLELATKRASSDTNIPLPQNRKDLEAPGSSHEPGHTEFAKNLEKTLLDFHDRREGRLSAFLKKRRSGTVGTEGRNRNFVGPVSQHQTLDHRQLYMALYTEHLVYCQGVAVLNLVRFADSKRADGTLSKNRFLTPTAIQLRTWHIHRHAGPELGMGENQRGREITQKDGRHTLLITPNETDIEHLPPANWWEYTSDHLRSIARFLRSPASVYGLRVACACLSVGIISFLRQSQEFFQEQRLSWTFLIIAISSSWTSGQSAFALAIRLIGTFLATISCLVMWYIVDGHTWGVIIFMTLFVLLESYYITKYPRFVTTFITAMVTQILIVGYGLQVNKIGVKASEITGQAVKPTYILAPYRLASSAAGSIVAYIWTVFPYPVTDRSKLREDLGESMYVLAKYYSCVHAQIVARFQGLEGDSKDSNNLGYQLSKSENALFNQAITCLQSLRADSAFTSWEFIVGGKFPRKTFESIVDGTQSLLGHFSLMSHICKSLPEESGGTWFRSLAKLLEKLNPTSQDVTSTLVLLSASIRNGSALPPYLRPPKYYQISDTLISIDSDILSMAHISEPGFAAYAALQVVLTLVSADLEVLIAQVKELVGEVDFKFLQL